MHEAIMNPSPSWKSQVRAAVAAALLLVGVTAGPVAAATVTYFNGTVASQTYRSYPYHVTVRGGDVAPAALLQTSSTIQTFWCGGSSGCPVVYYSTTSGGVTSHDHPAQTNSRSRCKWFFTAGGSASMGLTCRQW
jgi:hypothetical protein